MTHGTFCAWMIRNISAFSGFRFSDMRLIHKLDWRLGPLERPDGIPTLERGNEKIKSTRDDHPFRPSNHRSWS
jgi:hypothetical protein